MSLLRRWRQRNGKNKLASALQYTPSLIEKPGCCLPPGGATLCYKPDENKVHSCVQDRILLTCAKNFENCFGHSKYLCHQTPWRRFWATLCNVFMLSNCWGLPSDDDQSYKLIVSCLEYYRSTNFMKKFWVLLYRQIDNSRQKENATSFWKVVIKHFHLRWIPFRPVVVWGGIMIILESDESRRWPNGLITFMCMSLCGM